MSRRKIMLITVGWWFLIVTMWGVYYVCARILAIDATPGYETMWTFQCLVFLLTKLPVAVLVLAIILLSECFVCGRKKGSIAPHE